MTIKQDMKDIEDLAELIKDANTSRFNTRTAELLQRSLTHYRSTLLTRHTTEMLTIKMIREIVAKELNVEPDSEFFSMTWEEDYKPLGWSHDDFLIHIFNEEKAAGDYATDIDVILTLCHG